MIGKIRNLTRRIIERGRRIQSGFDAYRRQAVQYFAQTDLERGLESYQAALRASPPGVPLELTFILVLISHLGKKGDDRLARAILLPALRLILEQSFFYRRCDFTFRSLVSFASWAMELGDSELSSFIYALARGLLSSDVSASEAYLLIGLERLSERTKEFSSRSVRQGGSAKVVVPRNFSEGKVREEEHVEKRLPDIVLSEVKRVSIRGSVLLLRNREDEEAETEEGGGADIPLGLPGSKPIEIAKLGRSAQTLLAYEEYAEPWGASVAGHCHVVLGRVSEKQAIMRHQKPWGEAPRKASGVLMANRASSNYFHWMLETLAKVKYLEECGVRNEAFIIPAGMPIQHYQALQAAQGKDPSTWAYFHPLTGLDMDQLTVMSPPLSMSEDPGANARDTFAVYAEAVKDLSERILRNLAVTDGGRRRKIYLGRKGRIRGLANEPEIARFMVRHGFEIVYPEKLSFEEQVRTFRDASCVAGPSGAALTNIMFCRPGTVTLSLNADYHSENVVFSQIAESVGGKVWQITGPFVPRGSRERMLGAVDVLHQPYTVPVETVARALSEIDR